MLHELAKEADRVTKVGSRDGEIDQAADYLAIRGGVAHGRARVGIYFEVSIERSRHRFSLGESKLVE